MTNRRGKGKVTKLREGILRRRGLRKGRHGSLSEEGEAIRVRSEGTTLLQFALERVFDEDIDRLLDLTKSLKEVADRLGIDESTVSKWRLQRGLRTREQILTVTT